MAARTRPTPQASPAVQIAALALGIPHDQVTPEQEALAATLAEGMRSHPLPRIGSIFLLPGMGRVIEVGEGYKLTSTNFYWKVDNTFEVMGFEVFRAEVLKDCVLLFTPEQVRIFTRSGRKVSEVVFRLRLHGDDYLATAKRWIAAGRID